MVEKANSTRIYHKDGKCRDLVREATEDQKQTRKITKALSKIKALKEAQAAGVPLEQKQIEKFSSEAVLRAELEALRVSAVPAQQYASPKVADSKVTLATPLQLAQISLPLSLGCVEIHDLLGLVVVNAEVQFSRLLVWQRVSRSWATAIETALPEPYCKPSVMRKAATLSKLPQCRAVEGCGSASPEGLLPEGCNSSRQPGKYHKLVSQVAVDGWLCG